MRRSVRLYATASAAIVVSLTVALLVLEPVNALAIRSLLSSERALVIALPKAAELLEVTGRAAGYYVEVWAVVPGGVVEVYSAMVDPDSPIVRLTTGELKEVVGEWLGYYRRHGKHWRPALLLQVSAYSPETDTSALAFGASVVYDPELFISPLPRVEVHRVGADRFPVVERMRNVSSFSAGRCVAAAAGREARGLCGPAARPGHLALAAPGSYQTSGSGLPGLRPDPYSCDGCSYYFTRVQLVREIFDSSDPELPERFRNRIPLVIMYMDPGALTEGVRAYYDSGGYTRAWFRIGIFGWQWGRPIFGDPSGELGSHIRGEVMLHIKDAYSFLAWRGRFKLYDAYGYVCCYARLCDGSVAVTCEPSGWSSVVTVVTSVESTSLEGMFGVPASEFVDISVFRSKLEFESYNVPAQGVLDLGRGP